MERHCLPKFSLPRAHHTFPGRPTADATTLSHTAEMGPVCPHGSNYTGLVPRKERKGQAGKERYAFFFIKNTCSGTNFSY